jgi:hypothetical protein
VHGEVRRELKNDEAFSPHALRRRSRGLDGQAPGDTGDLSCRRANSAQTLLELGKPDLALVEYGPE